jgi:hypothetical protein
MQHRCHQYFCQAGTALVDKVCGRKSKPTIAFYDSDQAQSNLWKNWQRVLD